VGKETLSAMPIRRPAAHIIIVLAQLCMSSHSPELASS
jgi:hypothetical protein